MIILTDSLEEDKKVCRQSKLTAQIKVMESEADWLTSIRTEFPGLAGAQHWILCDSPTGTQVHQVGEGWAGLGTKYFSSVFSTLIGRGPRIP